MARKKAWVPLIKALKVRGAGGGAVWLQKTCAIDDGTVCVELREDDGASDGLLLRPIEAERVARALLRYAAHIRTTGMK
jgi:hypothetical protein